MINSEALKGFNDIMILYVLYECDSYGYEISKRIRTFTNAEYTIKETTLYSAFNRLEKNQYINKYYGTQTFGKPRIYYKITSAGKEYYLRRCVEWKKTVSIVNKFIKEED